MTDKQTISWPALLQGVRTRYPDLFRAWFQELPDGRLEGGELRVIVDNPAHARYLREACSSAFIQVAMSLTGLLISVRFICPTEGERIPINAPAADPLSSAGLNIDYTFDQFVVGPSNRLAHAACRAVFSQPGTLYNPLFIHGASGLGKTHLLQAICAQFIQTRPDVSVLYVTCEKFVNDFVRAIETGQVPQFREAARQVDVLAIDDVQFLASRESSQEELFHTFNVLYQSHKQIILSADSPPTEIPTLEERLVSRFNWGLVTQIDPPNRETRQAILHKKARLRGSEIPADVLDYIAERVESNVRVLEGTLTKLISATSIGREPMTLDMARSVLTEAGAPTSRPLQVGDILEAVSQHFGVKLSELIGRKRSRSISYPRQIGMYLARKLTPLSLEEIGLHFGGRDHSTVLHAERVIDASRQQSKDTAATLTRLTNQLLTRRP